MTLEIRGRDMRLKYGLYGGGHLLVLGTKNDMTSFYRLIHHYCKDIENIELISDRLYKKYVKKDDVDKTLDVMYLIGESFKKVSIESLENKKDYIIDSALNWKKDTLFDVYENIFKGFSEITIDFNYSIEDYGFSSKLLIKTVIVNIPYTNWIKELPQELFDNLTDEDEPFWMWDIDKLEALVKQQNPAYKNVHYTVCVLADK